MLSLFAFLLLAVPAGVFAQGGGSDPIENSAGTTYVVAFPDTTKNTFDARYPNTQYEDKAILFIYSAVDNKISIRGRGYNTMQTVVGQKFLVVDLSGGTSRAPSPIVIDHCKPVDNTFRIEAEHPVVVYQYLVTKFGTEAWTPIPTEAWGSEYYAAANEGEIGSDVSPGGEFDYNRKNKMFPAEILVIAAYDDTRITIVPNGAVHNNCRPNNITLKAGEAYQIQSYVDTLTANVGTPQPDFGGSRIFSTKPVGVISGNTRAQTIDENVGLGKNIFKNMLIEWVAPIEQHGTEFVYMPTWDSRRPTGAPGEEPADKRKAEFVRLYGTHEGQTQGFYMQGGVPIAYDSPIDQGKFAQIRHTPNLARVHKTDQPAQAMMYSAAVVKYAGTTQGFGGYIGAAYDGYGGYMVELTPREQWVDFAPYYASTHPAGMEHFINVVTDTNHMNDVYMKNGSNFIFQRRIEGTDLIWGSMAVQPGIDHWLEARNGAKFAGFVYGGMAKGGHEEYRPGRVKGQDDTPPTLVNAGGGDDPEPLHPSEYEEYLAIAYGYPLAPSRLVVGPGDSLGIKTKIDCDGMEIEIESLNENPVGLRSIRLDNSNNARIVSQNPFPITGAIKATIRVGPINRNQDASATIVIKDKTGKITRVEFTYYAERLTFVPDPPTMQFGVMSPGTPAEKTVVATNPLGRALKVVNVRLANGNPAFTIKEPTTFPFTMASGASQNITVIANPTLPDQEYIDTVIIELECTTWKIPVKAETSNPCINVHDLDFQTLRPGELKTLPLRICNDGGGEVTFNNPSGGAVIEWLLTTFTVSPDDILKIKNATLRRGDCITIMVSFSSPVVGTFQNTARLWASTRRCRDTSVWIARVTEPGPQITGYDWEQRWIVDGACSPEANPRGTKNPVTEYISTIYTFNTGDADFFVESIALVGQDAVDGHFVLGTTEQIKPGDKIRPVNNSVTPPDTPKQPQTVIFRPGPEERVYTCTVQLKSTDGRQVESTLRGIGIESHVQPPALVDFGRELWIQGVTTVDRDVVFTTNGTRPVTITGLRIDPSDPPSANQFSITNMTEIVGKTFPKDSIFTVKVNYSPTVAGVHTAQVVAIGDFSPCDDSTADIVARSYTLSARPHNAVFGTILTCFTGTQQIFVENDGSDTVMLAGLTQAGSGNFTVNVPQFPIFIAPGERYPVDVTFAPDAEGEVCGSVTFDVRDITGETPVLFLGNPVTAEFCGSGDKVTANAHIARDYAGLPGQEHIIEVILDEPIGSAQIDELDFSLRYAHGMMENKIDFTQTTFPGLVAGTIISNWTVTAPQAPIIDPADARIKVLYLHMKAPAGEFLTGTGTLLKIPFLTYIGDTTATELPFFLTPVTRLACADIVTSPGAAKIDSVCGLNFRLITAFGAEYALRQNSPNPFNPTTDIQFSLGLDAQTTLTVYNSKGEKVATLVDTYLKPGTYTVTWDASSMPSGLYYYRLNSGSWSRTESMMLQK